MLQKSQAPFSKLKQKFLDAAFVKKQKYALVGAKMNYDLTSPYIKAGAGGVFFFAHPHPATLAFVTSAGFVFMDGLINVFGQAIDFAYGTRAMKKNEELEQVKNMLEGKSYELDIFRRDYP